MIELYILVKNKKGLGALMGKTTLVIMAAGIGSRYGGGIKQLERVGPAGEIIMDYSVHDAIEAGFDKVVFIIRKDLMKDFKDIIGHRIEKKINVEYAFQELDNLPLGFKSPMNRTKPWGTGQAVLSCKNIVKEPFLVINADDYYGKESFVKIHEYLSNSTDMLQLKGNGANASLHGKYEYCMAGFILGNTLSDNGVVTRGVCKVDEHNMLIGIEEIFQIEKQGEKAVGKRESGENVLLNLESPVSMNMWGFTPEFFEELESGFIRFLSELKEENRLKAEYLLPSVIGEMIESKRANVKVLKTSDKWFGVTYKEDRQAVVNSIQKLINEGQYPGTII